MDVVQTMTLNFTYALFGGLMTLGIMVLGFKMLDKLTEFNTSDELKNGNQAVGITVAGIFIGTFIIFMIFSIMDSLGKQIDDRINSFHYKYYLESNDLNDNFVKGSSSVAYIEDDFSEEMLNRNTM